MTTIREVAKLAGVSVGTVSHVLSEVVPVSSALRARVWDAIRQLDFDPNPAARSLKAKKTKMLGMVISDITNPFFPLVVRGAEDCALENGYTVITLNTDDQIEREKQVLSVFRSRRVDGLLLVIAPGTGDVSHIESIIAAGTPVVCLDRIPPGLNVDSVAVDNLKGARACVHHLIMQGHTRIAILTGSLALQNACDRLKGYKLALREAGIKIDPELIARGDFRTATGHRLSKELLLRQHSPTAIFSSNGLMTLGALAAIEEVGLNCPEDIAVATFDDLPVAEVFRPHLTAVAQPAYRMGYEGVQLLVQRLRKDAPASGPTHIVLEPELKIRESTAAPRSRRPAMQAAALPRRRS
jgi:LacI family transcriptional regulator